MYLQTYENGHESHEIAVAIQTTLGDINIDSKHDRAKEMPNSLPSFPQLTDSVFETACTNLNKTFLANAHKQASSWLSLEVIDEFGTKYLRITTPLHLVPSIPDKSDHDVELEDDNDEELLVPSTLSHNQIRVIYDIFLSPTYRVPVLYFNISDPQHRYPSTMTTLYEQLIPAQYKAQAESVGVIGGITITVSVSKRRASMIINLSEFNVHSKLNSQTQALSSYFFLNVEPRVGADADRTIRFRRDQFSSSIHVVRQRL
jgi:ubiquitin-like-conjugating enzyme ATG10